MTEIISTIFPVYAIVALGYVLTKYKIVRQSWVKTLNSFVYYIALPALILVSLWGLRLNPEVVRLFIYHAGSIFVIAVALVWLLSLFRINSKQKAVIIMSALVGNTVYMGYPILSHVFSAADMPIAQAVATLQLVAGLVVSIIVVEHLVIKSHNVGSYTLGLLKNPLVLSFFAGLGLSYLPENDFINQAREPLVMLSITASPLALFDLGVFMYGKFSKIHFGKVALAVVFKLLLLPVIVYFGAKSFGFSELSQNISLFVSAMPAAITTFVIAEKYELDTELAANAILLSTVISAFTISLILLMGTA